MTDLETLIKNSKELSSLPEIYIRVSELLDDENSTSDQIGSVVQSDPALTARILKVVNSSFYGFPSEISTIAQAISILGRNPLRQLLMGSVLGSVFSRVSNDVFLMDDFWQHSVFTAVLSKFCYENLVGKSKSDELFVAGLLHKIGRLIIAHQLPDKSLKIQQELDSGDESEIELELKLLGFSHNEVGASIMQLWGLPTFLRSCTLHHLNPDEASKAFTTQTWIIHIASQFAYGPLLDNKDDISNQLNSFIGWEKTELTEEQIIEAYQHASEQFQIVLESLGL